MNLSPLHHIAKHQHGVLTLLQASEHGIGRPQWRALLRDGALVEVFPDVARLVGAPPTPLSAVKAATLAVPGSVASHTSAAMVWGAPCAGIGPVHISLDSRHRRGDRVGVALHRPVDTLDLEPIVRARIPTTRPLRTLCDIGAVDPLAVDAVLHHFLAAGTLKPDGVWRALEQHRRRGRAGVGPLEAALSQLALGSKPPDSLLEEVMGRLFRDFGLPPFEFHAIVAGFEIDFLVTGTPIIVETDGWSTHGLDRMQFERDREKDAVLSEAGYIVRRFSWKQVTKRHAWVAERIRGAIRQWAPSALAS